MTAVRGWWIGAATLAVHAAGVLALIGSATLVDGRPLAQLDWALHGENARTSRELWRSTGRIDGWSERLMGGYPHGTADSVSNRYGELATALLPIEPAPRAFGWAVALLLIAVPLGPAIAARALGGGRAAVLGALVLAIALVWRTVDGPRAYLQLGLYGHLAALTIAPAAIALALVAGLRRSVGAGVAAIATIALGWSCHLLFPLAIVPGLLVGAAVLGRGEAAGRRWIAGSWALLAAACGAALASPLWAAAWQARSHLDTLDSAFHQRGLAALWGETRSLWILLWCVGAWELLRLVRPAEHGAMGAQRQGDRDAPGEAAPRQAVALGLAVAAACLLLLAVLGPFAQPTARLQPVRFLDGVGFLLGGPAALGVVGLARRRRLVLVPVGLFLVVPLAPLAAQISGLAEPLVAWDESDPDPRIQGDLLPLVEALRNPSLPPGRLMIEENAAAPGRGMIWGDVLLPVLLPRLIARDTTARGIPDTRLVEGRIAFVDGVAFGRPLGEWSDAELEAKLERWRVGVIVAWSGQSIDDLSRRAGIDPVRRVGRFSIYRRHPPAGRMGPAPAVPVPATGDRAGPSRGDGGAPALPR